MGTLQVGGTTLGVKNTSTNKIDLSNASIGSDTVFPAGGTGNAISIAILLDEKGDNTDAGTSTESFSQRTLNVQIDPDSIVSLDSNQFTLGSGTYLISWSAPAINSNQHQSQLYNITGSAPLRQGSAMYCHTSAIVLTRSEGSFIHEITSNNVYEIRHRVEVAQSSYGFGVGSTFGTNNIYTIVVIYKLK